MWMVADCALWLDLLLLSSTFLLPLHPRRLFEILKEIELGKDQPFLTDQLVSLIILFSKLILFYPENSFLFTPVFIIQPSKKQPNPHSNQLAAIRLILAQIKIRLTLFTCILVVIHFFKVQLLISDWRICSSKR
ncbi:hypothetical protein XSR1_10361 [Xenorhabdus szentirmaii DSM 16338]|uniref:Uncharacterized protein n=1 Tax=Xenorhabdus szentirmaii DSM 16338 TaxID=1427518 RepID=W1IR44_9GAMM|nr:hypothetical protein XSR1_10361 [Xenorhabdus szentirmaii DSM 16338]